MDANKQVEPVGTVKEMNSLSLMKHMERIVDATKDKKLSQESLQDCSEHLSAVAGKLSLTREQVLLLAVFMDQCDDQCIRIRDLACHFDCRNINIMCYSEDIETLANKGYIRQRTERKHTVYRVPAEVITAIKKNAAYTPVKLQGLTAQQLFDELYTLFNDADDDELTFAELVSKTTDLLENNRHLLFVKKILENEYIKEEDRTLLLFFCHRLVNEDDDSVMFYEIERLYDSKAEYNSVKNELKKENHSLLIWNMIEPKKDSDMVQRDCYCLTERAKKELLPELNITIQEKSNPKNIILAKDITEKILFYNCREQGHIDQLVSLLDTDNFTKIQKRLAKNGMRKGFACLFYGAPGTGKTETVYQIARRTGRDIMYANVSEIKSMWVGESEKNIKALFDRYRNFTSYSKNAPILLFNEADAVIGIRQEGAERAVDKMENSIQNIILQEMEALDGIMIATTNLTQNLDLAFERRFLFKIEFDKPGLEAKKAIWRSMIPELSSTEVTVLAENYDFSGGQIENIARKRVVDHIIQGKRPTISMIHEYCKSELIHKTAQRNPIGFYR